MSSSDSELCDAAALLGPSSSSSSSTSVVVAAVSASKPSVRPSSFASFPLPPSPIQSSPDSSPSPCNLSPSSSPTPTLDMVDIDSFTVIKKEERKERKKRRKRKNELRPISTNVNSASLKNNRLSNSSGSLDLPSLTSPSLFSSSASPLSNKKEKEEKKEDASISRALSQAFSRNVQFGGALRLSDVARGATFVFFSSGASAYSVREWVKAMEKTGGRGEKETKQSLQQLQRQIKRRMEALCSADEVCFLFCFVFDWILFY